ncbi:PREDICTED: cyclin-B1-2 [Camelina sativa]|uniref:Cyclin-B1-2 n=1 Tax=Camelina sativa TaxID=90675 RepID=A0ABM0XUD7_CAMSA|nr:PREDICTED: cyclin-B1-2 [Camelina sativa]
MATRAANVPEQVRGAPLVDGLKIQNKNGAAKNRRALGDIGNLVSVPGVQGGKAQPQINRPITRSFRAQLLANAQIERKPINVDNKVVGPKRQPLATRNPEAPKAVQKKNLVVKQQQQGKAVAEVVESKKEVTKKKEAAALSPKNKKVTYSSVLSARSKAACGIANKPKILDIDESDKDNHLAAVEYVDDMYSYYKEVEKESQAKMYMHIQTEMNEKMRAILIDWLLEVHIKFELNLETLYLTVNIIDRFLSVKAVPKRELQLLGISALLIASKYEEIWPPQVNDLVYVTDNAYSSKQILVMEKTILGNLEWYLTVPTQYVFLVRFIKASMSDPEMENMVHFLAELGMMHYDTLMFCPSMLAASAVYTARCSLNKSPAWTDTLQFHTGYTESEIMDCSKLLAFLHSRCGESRLRAVYKKYSKAENGGVALVSAAKSLLSAASDLKKPSSS